MVTARVLCALGLLPVIPVFGQARNYNITFGPSNWLNFYNEVLTTIPCTYQITARNATMSEPDGALCMIVDENGIHNANFDLVQGGAAATLGWPAELASILIPPKPEAPLRYFVFVNTTETTKQAGYVEVDMSANLGTGAVIGGPTWYMSNCTGKLAATPDSNGADYWLVQHADGTDEFHSFRLTTSGLLPTPVISTAGPMLGVTGSNAPYSSDYYGSMRFSVGGNQMLMSFDVAPDTMASALYWFDATTGSVSLRTSALRDRSRYIDPFTSDTLTAQGISAAVVGVDFMATDDFAYVTYLDTTIWDGSGDSHIVQYDLSLDEEQIAEQPLGISGHQPGLGPWGVDTLGTSLILAADGKLYLRGPYQNWGVLEQFNSLPVALGGPPVNPAVVYMPGTFDTWALPLFCKRYHDSEPAWLGVRDDVAEKSFFRVVPNPIAHQGAMTWGNSPQPDHLVWRDALGRVVRSEPALNNGPTTVLARKELSTGLYMVEVLRDGKTLGTSKVMFE
ncbi:MAG: hypothetical protein IPI07_03625 [Flavobacteriales bacterium]|nr:hypothetical protein [Flavobacteriales bacterium]